MERMVSATWSSFCFPSRVFAIESSIRPVVSRAACADRWARLRTSSATTAKPTGFARARRFHGCVEGEDIALERRSRRWS